MPATGAQAHAPREVSIFSIYQSADGVVFGEPPAKRARSSRRLLYILLSGVCALFSLAALAVAVVLVVTAVRTELKPSEWVDYNRLGDDDPAAELVVVTECGRTFSAPSIVPSPGRIINGVEAVNHSFPWLVSLRKMVHNRIYDHFCAGSIITDDAILTAAHCIRADDVDVRQVVAVTGLHASSQPNTDVT